MAQAQADWGPSMRPRLVRETPKEHMALRPVFREQEHGLIRNSLEKQTLRTPLAPANQDPVV